MNRTSPRVLGALTLLWSVVLLATFPATAGSLPAGFFSPVIAFEFARTPAEVVALFSRGGVVDPALAAAMDRGNGLDFVFLLLYAGFLATAAPHVVPKEPARRVTTLALLAASADAVENLQLLSLTGRLDAPETMHGPLLWLAAATWLKWGALTAALALVARHRGDTSRVAYLSGLAAAASISTAVMAWLTHSVLNELWALLLTAQFLLLWITVLRDGEPSAASPGATDASG